MGRKVKENNNIINKVGPGEYKLPSSFKIKENKKIYNFDLVHKRLIDN